MGPERLITLTQAAALSGLTRQHLSHLARTGKLKAWRLGRRLYTTEDAVRAYVHDPEARSHDPLKEERTRYSITPPETM